MILYNPDCNNGRHYYFKSAQHLEVENVNERSASDCVTIRLVTVHLVEKGYT